MCGACTGTLPDTFWADAYFADVGAILYTPRGYGSEYTGGCADMLGPPSKSHFKAPGWTACAWGKVILHESGHAVFARVDTYCGDTYYDPFANVGSSETACRNELKSKGGDQSKCRQILYDDPNTAKNPDCSKDYWKWDPDPDLMNDHFGGNFGPRDVGKINYMFLTYTGA